MRKLEEAPAEKKTIICECVSPREGAISEEFAGAFLVKVVRGDIALAVGFPAISATAEMEAPSNRTAVYRATSMCLFSMGRDPR